MCVLTPNLLFAPVENTPRTRFSEFTAERRWYKGGIAKVNGEGCRIGGRIPLDEGTFESELIALPHAGH